MIAAQSVIRKSRKLFDTIFRRRREPKPPVTQYQYLKDDGSFDYERYRRIQTEGNRQKIHITWAVEPNIAFLANYIQGLMVPTFGICHGTRRGDEQTWFRKPGSISTVKSSARRSPTLQRHSRTPFNGTFTMSNRNG
jgi:hypothetical protein